MTLQALLYTSLLILALQSQCEGARTLQALVPTAPLVLPYHKGPILSGPSKVYFLWYGNFTIAQKSILTDFISSFSSNPSSPSVKSWWSTTSSYKDTSGSSVSPSISMASQISLPSTSGSKILQQSDLLALLLSSFSSHSLPIDAHGIYFIFTDSSTLVQDFCMSSCGYHASTPASTATNHLSLPFAWVGNPSSQCPGYCAWPFAIPQFGPPPPPLVSPNHDVGLDGMVINMATLLAGIATNTYDTGYYQGDATAPLEAVSACTGIFGKGAYPGNPGTLLTDQKTGASYNAHGANGRMFLLPAMWSPKTLSCTPLS